MEIIKGRRHVYVASIAQGNDALDLKDYEAEFVLSRGIGTDKTLKKAGVINESVSGNVEFTLVPEDLEGAEAGHYRFEVNIWKSDDCTVVFTPIEGSVEVREALDVNPTTV